MEPIRNRLPKVVLDLELGLSLLISLIIWLNAISFGPFLWDYYSVLEIYATGLAGQFKSLWHSGAANFRPTYALIALAQYRMFGTEFWAYYLFKMAVFSAVVAAIIYIASRATNIDNDDKKFIIIFSLL